MNDYQKEQWDACHLALDHLELIHAPGNSDLKKEMDAYLDFRRVLGEFLKLHFSDFCTKSCFQSKNSACCSKDGIITFWGDVVVNLYSSSQGKIDKLLGALEKPFSPQKCIYLNPEGCVWETTPLGCALFLCDAVQANVFGASGALREQWDHLKEKARGYRWPDRVVLFDRLETLFMDAGCRSPLMYINTSPGLLRVKQQIRRP